tara:strand:- start:1534 stop:1980 length:447 start_codon:yes stop_codon:yes gene_type:complete
MYATLTVEFSATNADIFLDIFLNNNFVTSNTFVKGTQQYTIAFDDTDTHTEQCVKLVMLGKTQQHTKIDSNANILSDHYAMIKQIVIDEIDVTDLYVNGNLCYYHTGSNNNKNGPLIVDEFYGFIGYNGDIKLEFTTPMWKWFNSKCS